jgi:hypothetical protein
MSKQLLKHFCGDEVINYCLFSQKMTFLHEILIQITDKELVYQWSIVVIIAMLIQCIASLSVNILVLNECHFG